MPADVHFAQQVHTFNSMGQHSLFLCAALSAVALLSYLLKAIKPWLYSIKIIWIETHGIATILGN